MKESNDECCELCLSVGLEHNEIWTGKEYISCPNSVNKSKLNELQLKYLKSRYKQFSVYFKIEDEDEY